MSRAGLRYGTAAASALALALAHPPTGWTPLAFVAMLPWFTVLLRDGGAGHRGPAVLFGLLYFATGLRWLFPLFPLFPFAVAAILSLYPLLFAVLVRLASPLGPARTALLLPALWVATDLLRQHLLTGFPWLLPGHALAGSRTLRQAADLGGAHLLTAAVLLPAAAGALWGMRPAASARARWGMAAGAILLPVGLALYGSVRCGGLRERPGPRVLVVQPAFAQSLKAEARASLPRAEEIRNRQLALSLEGLRLQGDADLVIWAETMIPGELRQEARGRPGPDPETRRVLHHIADPVGVVPGKPRRFLGGAQVRDPDRGLRNAVLLVGPRGAVEGRFDKEHLTPFGEYLPLLWLLPGGAQQWVRDRVDAVSPFVPDMVPGRPGCVDLEIPGPVRVRLGGLVCYEVLFPALARDRAREGADVLLNLANYAWYGPGVRGQALDLARLCAVQTRRPVVVATNDGPTAILDGNGEVRTALEPGEAGTLRGEVGLDGRGSLYLLAGDLLAWLLAAAGGAGAVLGWRRGRPSAGNAPGTLKNC